MPVSLGEIISDMRSPFFEYRADACQAEFGHHGIQKSETNGEPK